VTSPTDRSPWSGFRGVGAVADVVLAVAAVAAAFLTWRAAHALTQIERQRWHADLTPEFDASVDGERLLLTFTGPAGLHRLDEVTVTICDEGGVDRLGQMPAGSATREDVVAHVWAPRCFDTAAKDQTLSNTGRTARAHLIRELGSWHPLLLMPSRPPEWSAPTPEDLPAAVKRWGEEYADKPLRLLITCRREGDEPWHVARAVDAPSDGWPTRSWP
jgi:hypothetical protein